MKNKNKLLFVIILLLICFSLYFVIRKTKTPNGFISQKVNHLADDNVESGSRKIRDSKTGLKEPVGVNKKNKGDEQILPDEVKRDPSSSFLISPENDKINEFASPEFIAPFREMPEFDIDAIEVDPPDFDPNFKLQTEPGPEVDIDAIEVDPPDFDPNFNLQTRPGPEVDIDTIEVEPPGF